jgi:hypothetical protein
LPGSETRIIESSAQEKPIVSHIVTIRTEVRDAEAVRAACRRLGAPAPVHGTHKVFTGEVQGLAVQLPGWQYPVVCDLDKRILQFDNFGGRWGEQRHLDRFLQAYACEKAKIEARRNGHSVTEQELPDGCVRLTIQVSGGVS